MSQGYIHSIESFGVYDGPGIRTVFFLQGCPLRCLYCHNPDSQEFQTGEIWTKEKILNKARSFRSYYESSGGGVTFSGGEPLVQADFVLDCFQELKKNKISTCLDTSGVYYHDQVKKILDYTDVILLDVKAFSEEGNQLITAVNFKGANKFLDLLKDYQGQLIIRHVMLPGYTNNSLAMIRFKDYLLPYVKQIDKIEILPYHTHGVSKYKELGLEYPLAGLLDLDRKVAMKYELELKHWLEQRKERL